MLTQRLISHLALISLLLTSVTSAQVAANKIIPDDKVYSGVVRNLNTHKEIGNVNITIAETQIGTITDYSGKFSLAIPSQYESNMVTFQHVGYELLQLTVDSLRNLRYVYLQPRVIELRGVEVEGEGHGQAEIASDLHQPIEIVAAKEFEIRGYVDAGDLLRTDQSVQVDEDLSGRKTIAIRGGNPDEVVVLYNGVKMNSNYDNVFDFSLIDLEDIARFEIVKGSNTSLYGPEAFSGIINIVPKLQQDYSIRFQQRLGTYRSGNWGLHLYQDYKRLSAGYSLKKGGARRQFVESTGDEDGGITNNSTHHTANLSYSFSYHEDGRPANTLGAMWVFTALEYDNLRDNEFLENDQHIGSISYSRETGPFKDLKITLSQSILDETQNLLSPGAVHRRVIDDHALHLDLEKQFRLAPFELVTAYQMRLTNLDFADENAAQQLEQIGLVSAKLKREHHGIVSILKLNNNTDAKFLNSLNLGLSFRHDMVRDKQEDPIIRRSPSNDSEVGLFGENSWNETVLKFSLELSGYQDYLFFKSYLNFGTNVKFPTLFQQISSPSSFTNARFEPNLNPEKNRSIEIGFDLAREFRGRPAIYGWSIAANYFMNHYDNKFRQYATPGIPVTFYDNVLDARISGIEAKSDLYFFKKKLTFRYGLSKYAISEKAAFPFKSDIKHTFSIYLDHAGYSFQLLYFREGAQVGWLRLADPVDDPNSPYSNFGEIELPSFSNLDLHLSKEFEIMDLNLFLNVSGRNLLHGSDVILEGLAIRDRRFYLTIGAQY